MSECSSAVLELNDADADDTEAPSVADEPNEGAPLIMEHGYDIAVKVDAPMKQLSTLETYVTYRVRCVCARWPAPPAPPARRRYNHFKVLHGRLCAAHPLLAPPPLPPLHSARQQLDRYSPGFVAVRALALHAFLDRVAKHPILTHSEDFRLFLTTPDEDIDRVFRNENSALNLWGLSSALYGGNGDSKPANGARVKDPEFTSTTDYLQSLQQKLTTLCALTTKLYKGSTALGTELMGMKRACDAWATQAGGRSARGAAGCGAGAGGAAAALARRSPPLRHRATLPLLAAYAAAHAEKIRQRDAIHAAHVAGTNAGELHNRLEQASEALRSELSDWLPKTHSEIKSLLLDLADRQVSIYSQTLMGWEHALKLSTETELFKTVSKTAVQNLSPSKCRAVTTPTETERDFDDLDSNDDFEFDNCDRIDRSSNFDGFVKDVGDMEAGSSKDGDKMSKAESKLDCNESKSDSDMSKLECHDSKSNSSMIKLECHDVKSDSNMKLDLAELEMDSNVSKLECNDSDMSKLELESDSNSNMLKLECNDSKSDSNMSKLEENDSKSNSNILKLECNDSKSNSNMLKLECNDSKSESNMLKLECNDSKSNSNMSKIECHDSRSDSNMLKLECNDSKSESNMPNLELESNMSKLEPNSDSKMTESESNASKSENGSKTEVISDPLQSFSEVDLSS